MKYQNVGSVVMLTKLVGAGHEQLAACVQAMMAASTGATAPSVALQSVTFMFVSISQNHLCTQFQ